jgi:hypothetical protein
MSEEKKKDALADALAALAAGEHHDDTETEGSEIDGHAHIEPVVETSAPVSRRPGPPTPRAGGGPPTPVARSGAPIPKQATTPAPAQSISRTPPPRPAAGTRSPAPLPPSSSTPPPARSAGTSSKSSVPLRPASPNSKVRPAMPGQGAPVSPGRESQAPPTHAATPQAFFPTSSARPASPRPASAVPARSPVPPPTPLVEEVAPPAEEPFVQEPTAEELAIAHEAEVQAEADAVGRVVEDDDTLNLPSPSPESLAYRRNAPGPKRQLASRTVGFKQTLIPILLTLGILLSGIAIWSLMLGEESPVATATWIPIALVAIGVIMLVFGVITMLQVKAQLDRQAQT